MDEIYEANDRFDFEKLLLTKPIMISGGNFFIRFLLNNTPLYIQPPKCVLKQGINKAGKKFYCDLMFSNEDDSFIRWVENLENASQHGIFNNREKWFETDLEMHDIENSFTSTLKIFKSGKNYVLRVNVPNVLGKCTLKVYDEDENEVEIDKIEETTDVMAILEFKGIKCSARSFQIDIEMKQLMILKPKKLFEKCIFKTNKLTQISTHDTSENKTDEKFSDINSDIPTRVVENIIVEKSEENIVDDKTIIDNYEIEKNDEQTEIIEKETNSDETEEKVLDDALQQDDNVENEVNNPQEDQSKLDEIIDPFNSLTDSNTLEEIDIDLAIQEQNDDDVVKLKARNDVYYEMYKEALNKARTARDLALSNYLEAKRIKNTYLLIDDDADNEDDFDQDLKF